MNFAIRNETGERFMLVPGARLRFRDEGGEFPIVFIHGWTLDLEMWEPQANALRDAYRIVRMDRRGFGASAGPASLIADVQDLQHLLDYLQLERVALVGMSQGARVAMHAALRLQKRLACLVLDGAPLDVRGGDVKQKIAIEYFRDLIESKGIDAFRTEWLEHPLMRLHAPQAWSQRLLQSMVSRYSGGDLLIDPACADAAPDSVQPGNIQIPTLVLNGEFDVGRRRMGDALCAAIPNAQRSIIGGAGHLPNLDSPHAYNQVLSHFIEQHSHRAPKE
jgi:pimeloyl-ACP methyl ester carboxylesterase